MSIPYAGWVQQLTNGAVPANRGAGAAAVSAVLRHSYRRQRECRLFDVQFLAGESREAYVARAHVPGFVHLEQVPEQRHRPAVRASYGLYQVSFRRISGAATSRWTPRTYPTRSRSRRFTSFPWVKDTGSWGIREALAISSSPAGQSTQFSARNRASHSSYFEPVQYSKPVRHGLLARLAPRRQSVRNQHRQLQSE